MEALNAGVDMGGSDIIGIGGDNAGIIAGVIGKDIELVTMFYYEENRGICHVILFIGWNSSLMIVRNQICIQGGGKFNMQKYRGGVIY